MIQHRQPASTPSASTPSQARELAERMTEVMTALLDVLQRETDLVRLGDVREAMKLAEKKSELSARYINAIAYLKASQGYFVQAAPELVASLQRQHEIFRGKLQLNLTVLATAHAVTEGIVRGVNVEMQRRNVPNTYTASGHRAVAGPRHITPLAVSRSL
jgi:hypothetical protein